MFHVLITADTGAKHVQDQEHEAGKGVCTDWCGYKGDNEGGER